jgi:hypothetical protein
MAARKTSDTVQTSWTRVTPEHPVAVGSSVDVRSRYIEAWSHGFTVAEHVDRGCLIRRLSDGSVLPDVFGWSEVRAESRNRDVA